VWGVWGGLAAAGLVAEVRAVAALSCTAVLLLQARAASVKGACCRAASSSAALRLRPLRRTLGAPDTVPAGSAALSASQQSRPGRRLPVTVLLMCITWLYRSTSISFSTCGAGIIWRGGLGRSEVGGMGGQGLELRWREAHERQARAAAP
jgi:hypothetical protein